MSVYTSGSDADSPFRAVLHATQSRAVRRPVVIYDSGVGGISVAKHFLRACPQQDVVYVADNAWFPYGNKAEGHLRARVAYMIEGLTKSLSPLGILVACNTASTVVIEQLGEDCPPVVGVLPPVAEAVQAAGGGKIALLATPGTASRGILHDCINQHAVSEQVLIIGSLELVYLAEEKMALGGVSEARVNQALDSLIPPEVRATVQAVILGCTHFPLIQQELHLAFPNATHWIDPAAHASQRLQALLPMRWIDPATPADVGRRIVLTSDHNRVALEKVFARQGFTPLDLRLPVLMSAVRAASSNPMRATASVQERAA